MRAIYLCLLLAYALPVAAAGSDADRILAASGVRGGLIVHLGCGEGRLSAALRAADGYTVHGLDTDPANVATARDHLRQQGLYGSVTIDRLAGSTLPYVDNLVNLVVVSGSLPVAREEVLRVLCPRGVAVVLAKDGNQITETFRKPLPDAIDEWTHYLHDASGNAVSQDTVVGPPRRLQWVGSPKYSRHHDRMSSVSAVVSSGGRVFTIFDEASPASILAPPQWRLIARDAFNGTILWKRDIERWHTHLWPLKSGPAQLPRRLVAAGQRVYVTLAMEGPVQALDAATGETLCTYADTAATEEILLDDGVLFLRVNPDAAATDYEGLRDISQAVRQPFYDEQRRQIMAVRADTGQVLWTSRQGVLPGTLAVGAEAVFFHDGQSVVALGRESGQALWRSEPVDRKPQLQSLYMPTLVVYDDVVLFSGKGRGSAAAGRGKGEQLTALCAKTGDILWNAEHPSSGYKSPEDVLVAGGLVWCGETTVGSGVFTGRDPRTGEVKAEFPPDTDVFWFHHRCYRGKATENYLLMSRTGVEFVDFRNQQWLVNHWVRGACLYGVMPANGLLYAPQHPCACYSEAKLSGFNALAPAMSSDGDRLARLPSPAERLQRGPAYGDASSEPAEQLSGDDWPTYRSDNQRSGRARSAVDPNVVVRWQTEVGGELTSPVVAGGQVYLADRDTHTVHALSAAEGRRVWSFTAGGTVDSPPTVSNGRVLFGSADGYVYCLRASDGALAWRFLAAPVDQRLMAFEQLESVWPVHGSILVRDGEAWFVAGRSVFLDGGMRLWRLDATTGQVLSETVLDDRDPATGADRHTYVSWLNMPVGLPDILSSSGEHVYMRSQAIDRDGKLLPLERFPRTGEGHGGRSFAPPPNQDPAHAHLFSPTGFLDDSWWHRTYWLYGSRFYSGWSAYYLSGKVVPAGRILVFDDALVYGYGRKPPYYRWTTPIENHLFAADKKMPPTMDELPPAARRADASPPEDSLSRVQVPNSASLDPAGKPLSVEAWIKADQADGVVLAHGGNSMGYALYLQQGRPHFRVHAGGQGETVAARESIAECWRHVAGVLTEDKKLQVYVDGTLAGSATAPTFVPKQPMEGIDIGADSNTTVADYGSSNQFRGQIDELRLYYRALSGDEIARRAAADTLNTEDRSGAVLAFSFDKPKATDLSGNENHGTVQKAKFVEGKYGRALLFHDASRDKSSSRVLVNHRWSTDLPLMPRAMVLADDILFVAGPPDLVDEEQAARTIGTPETQAAVAAQAAAMQGERGAMLRAVSAGDGRVLAEQSLDSPPVFDGMAAADGHLLLVTLDGRVLCLGQHPR